PDGEPIRSGRGGAGHERGGMSLIDGQDARHAIVSGAVVLKTRLSATNRSGPPPRPAAPRGPCRGDDEGEGRGGCCCSGTSHGGDLRARWRDRARCPSPVRGGNLSKRGKRWLD